MTTTYPEQSTRSGFRPRYVTIIMVSMVALGLGACLFAGWWVTHGVRLLAKGVTVEAIQAVQPGMTEAEVIAILGEPFERGPSGYPNEITFTYSKPAYFARWYPMLWVHFQDGKLYNLTAQRRFGVFNPGHDNHRGLEKVGVYWTGIDGYGKEGWYKTELFEQTFPSEKDQRE